MSRLSKSNLRKAFYLLEARDRKKLIGITIIQIAISLLDLLGVLFLGLVGAIAVSGLQGALPGSGVLRILEILNLSDFVFQKQVAALGALAVLFLVGRTIISVFLTRKVMFFLSRRGAVISSNIISKLLNTSLTSIQSRSTQEVLYATTRGVDLIVLQVLAMTSILISDISLLFVLSVGLLLVDPVTALMTLLMFSFVGAYLYHHMRMKAVYLGASNSKLTITSSERIVEVINSFRELLVRGRREHYATQIASLRLQLSEASAESAFMPFISKYVIESVVIVGGVFIGTFQFLVSDATQAITTLTIFMAAGTRIAPSVLRVQQSLIQIKSSLSAAQPTLNLVDELDQVHISHLELGKIDFEHHNFSPKIILNGLSMSYPGNAKKILQDIHLEIDPGSLVAIVGPSGSGKTSLIDVLLGVIPFDQGSIEISGLTPSEVVKEWPGAIAYVPQEVSITSGTLRENIALGFPSELATNELLNDIVKTSLLGDLISSLPDGLDSYLGERGARVSGGEKQRIGIARALFTNPKLIVLDEATSALDGESEDKISLALQSLRGSKTLILVAHRLSTVRNADLVIYLDHGRILAIGTFEDVRQSVPDFDHQANLMGI
jgi:ABC-type multidrug transport system fused ATPase/permease subunit